MENISGEETQENQRPNNCDQLTNNNGEMLIKNELLEFGFMLEHIELALKMTSDKQEAIDL